MQTNLHCHLKIMLCSWCLSNTWDSKLTPLTLTELPHEQCSSWETNGPLAGQEIYAFHGTQKSLPWSPVPPPHLIIVSQLDWVCVTLSYSFHIHFKIIFPSRPSASKSVCIHFSSPPSCHNHFMLLDLMSQIIFGKEYKLWRSWLCNFSSSLLLPPPSAQISSLVFYPRTPSVHIYPFISAIKFSHPCKQQAKLFFSIF